MGKLIVVAGAQYGSEAKGHLSDQLTRVDRAGTQITAVRVAGPNAGHTVYGACPFTCLPSEDDGHYFNGEFIGHPWKLRSVPVAAVSNPHADLVIAAGSEIDPGVLKQELADLDAAGYKASQRMYVDSQATMLLPQHIEDEEKDGITERLGSTAKGIGAARADRIWRYADLAGEFYGPSACVDTADLQYETLSEGGTVLIEGTQGYGLGLHAGNYPYCTSSDCRVVDFLAMAGVSPWHPTVTMFEPWLVARVRPIRVAGNSGPLKGETSWDDLGLPEERTTVTNKVRRVGDWDADLVRQAVHANGGGNVKLALTMVDTLMPHLAGVDSPWRADDRFKPEALELSRHLHAIREEVGATVEFVGTGPSTGFFTN